MPMESSRRAIRFLFAHSLLSLGPCLCLPAAFGQSPRVLYTWEGTGDVRGWIQQGAIGENVVLLENAVDGELTLREMGPPGTPFAFEDDANTIAEGGSTIGGLDLTGLSALEFDLGHDGEGEVDVQFYVQATPGFRFIALGPDQPVSPGVMTYIAPLTGLAGEEIAYIRVIGVSVRAHEDEGELVWTLREVRSAGEPLAFRDFATHEPGTSDGGLQGAIVNFDTAGVEGNDGGQNQTGLVHNVGDSPPGNTGSLQWVDLAAGPGAAITWHNGTAFGGNTFNERPADMSNYTSLLVRIAATNVNGGAADAVGVQYFLQTGNFNFRQAGVIQQLVADGEFHTLEFSIGPIPDLDFVQAHGVNLQSHPAGDLRIDVDNVRAVAATGFPDCNANGVPDERDLADGTSLDCNRNGLPDECDIEKGASEDCDSSGTPDECDIAGGPVERVLYTWEGSGDVRGWIKNFGPNEAVLENRDGELIVLEDGEPGTAVAVSDGFDIISEDALTLGGLDVTGMSALEFDLEHTGFGAVDVQFFVQATPEFEYVALGPDVSVTPDLATYRLGLDGLTRAQLTYIRTIGLNIREHLFEGNLEWHLLEVRVTGTPLTQRDYATHEKGSSDGGLQGAIVTFDNAAVAGNDGQQNQTGLSHNLGAEPPGNTGSLRWTDVAGANGGAVSWFNGTAWLENSFNERPTDMSAYTSVVVRLAAASVTPGAVSAVDVQYFLQTNNFNFFPAGEPQSLPADGEFHELVFPIGDIPDRAYVDGHGIDLGEHLDGDLVVDVDRIRAVSDTPTANDCNGNRVPDRCDLEAGVLTDADEDGTPDECAGEAEFLRGDANASGRMDLSDAVFALRFLFAGGPDPLCFDATDANDSGELNLTDGVFILNRLFRGGNPIPPPGTEVCGPDPTDDGLRPCEYPEDRCP